MANYERELKQTIFKILREAHDLYRDDFYGHLTSPRIRGMLPVWYCRDDILKVYLDAPQAIMISVQFGVKTDELRFTDLVFNIAPEVINEYEIMENLLIGLVSLYAKFKEQRNAL